MSEDKEPEAKEGEFWEAYWVDFIAAQRELKNVPFDLKNTHFNSQYASLAAVRDAIIPVFNRHGFAVFQELWGGDKGPIVKTILAHKSGESREFGTLEMPAGKQDAQGWAGAITYARRLALLSMAGVTGDYDDDGEAAVAAPQPKASKGTK